MEDYLKAYKYYDTENRRIDYFKVYDLSKNLHLGLVYKYGQAKKTDWSIPIDKIAFKLTKDEKKLKICHRTNNNSYVDYLFKWANRLIVIDYINFTLIPSLTGWVQMFRRILKELEGFTEAQTAQVLRGAFAKYFFS